MARVDEVAVVDLGEALEIVRSVVGNDVTAKQIIADGMRSGRVRVFTDLIWETDRGDFIDDEWIARRSVGNLYEEDVEVPPDFFLASRRWPDDVHFWRWDASEVLILVSDEADDRQARYHLRGVELPKNEVLRLAGLSERKGIGGAPRKEEAWREFWHGAIQLALDHQLKNCGSPNAVASRILENMLVPLNENTVRSEAKLIFERFCSKIR